VDNFGNLISNIHRRDLESFLESFEPVIEVGDLTIKRLRPIYADAQEGEPLALINSSDWLEIAVNLGRATQCVGLPSEKIIGAEVKVSKTKRPF
jgi:S-adenosylmethionine hydrolase